MIEELTDGVLILRRYCLEDAADLFDAATESRAEVFPWMPWCHSAYDIQTARAWIGSQMLAWADHRAFEFCVRTMDGAFVGGGGINNLMQEYPVANLGYWVRTRATGRGHATRAARLLARFAVEHVGLQRVEIVVAAGNAGSLRVAANAGAKREGSLRNRIRLHGVKHDAVMHSIIPEDVACW